MLHKKRTRVSVILFIAALSVLGFFVGGILLTSGTSVSPDVKAAADTTTYASYLQDKFGYIRPGGASGGDGKLGSEYFGMNGTEEIQFSVYNEMLGGGKLPVFSSTDMVRIAQGTRGNPSGVGDTFVMLKPGDRLVLELSNFRNRGAFGVSRNGDDFTARTHTAGDITAPEFSLLNMGGISNTGGGIDGSITNFTNVNPNVLAYNSAYSLRGVFTAEGYYNFSLTLGLDAGIYEDWRVFEFSFYLVHATEYQLHPETFSPSLPSAAPSKGMLLMQSTRPRQAGTDPNSYFFNYATEVFPHVQFDNTRFKIDVIFEDHRKVVREGCEDSPIDANGEWTSRITRRDFNQMGTYIIRIKLGFYNSKLKWTDESGDEHIGKFVEADTWTVYEISLTNFGFQAQLYDNEIDEESWFGGKESHIGTRIYSDISARFTGNVNVDNNATNPDAAILRVTQNLPATVAVTNMPSVRLRYNVPHLFGLDEWQERTRVLSRVAYLAPDSTVWDVSVGAPTYKYEIGRPFDAPGTYAVLVYYTYPAAENYQTMPNDEDFVFFQVFYFKINNIVSDVMVALVDEVSPGVYDTVGGPFPYSEIVKDGRYSHPFMLYSINASIGGVPLGPYEKQPQYWLTYYKFGEKNPALGYPKNISASVITNEPKLYDEDGTYVFSVHFGNTIVGGTPQNVQEFTVVVDRSPINPDTFKATSTNPDSEYIVSDNKGRLKNVSVFGGGEVMLEWGAKESGVGIREVFHAHYPISWKNAVIGQSVNARNITSGWALTDVIGEASRDPSNHKLTSPGLDWVTTADKSGFKLLHPLVGSGLHVLNIIDGAGNENIYIIIIDTTSAGFAQMDPVPSNNVNVHSKAVTVGMGSAKVVPFFDGTGGFYNANIGESGSGSFITPMAEFMGIIGSKLTDRLINSGVLVNMGTGKYGYSIPIKKADISTDNRTWTALNHNTAVNDGSDELLRASRNTSEASFEHNGNTIQPGQYSVVLNNSLIHRRDFFFKVEDATGNVGWHYVQINPDHSQGIIFEDTSEVTPATGTLPGNTAGVVQDAGISRGEFLTFSLLQQSIGNDRITNVDIYFYKFTYETDTQGNKSSNYPFSTNYSNYFGHHTPPVSGTCSICSSPAAECRGGIQTNLSNQRLYFPLFRGNGAESARGLYAIKRTYAGTEDKERWYYVIADYDPIVLPSGEDKFETGVTIQFGDKIARDKDFKRLGLIQDNAPYQAISSNSQGVINIPTAGKYSKNTFNLKDSSNQPLGPMDGKPFTSLNLNFDVERLTDNGFVSQGDVRTLGDGIYKLNLTDGAGGFLWNITTMQAGFAPPNKSVIGVDITISGPVGTFRFNGTPVTASTYNHGDKNKHLHSVRLYDDIENKLSFEFYNDSDEFLSTITSVRWKRNQGNWVSVSLSSNPIGLYRYDTTLGDEGDGNRPIFGRDAFIVEMTSSVGISTFECVIDDSLPSYNRDRVRAADSFINDSSYSADLVAAGVSYENYPFAISENFTFEYANSKSIQDYNSATSYNPFIDTYRAEWSEVDNTLANAPGGGDIEYYFAGDANAKTFAQIVGLQPNQNRFFKITEYDEVGYGRTPTVYFVQLRGSAYRDSITLGSDIRMDGEGINAEITVPTHDLLNKNSGASSNYRNIYGIDMKLGNVQTYYSNNLFFNPFFEIKIGSDYVRRFGEVTTFDVQGLQTVNNKQSGAKFKVDELAVILQKMIDNTINNSAPVVVNNRFEAPANFKFDLYHIAGNVPLPRIVSDSSASSASISVDVNVPNMPSMFLGEHGLRFAFEVYDMLKDEWAGGVPQVVKETLDIQLDDLNGEYLIIITDKFGRQLFHEYNGTYSSKVEFNYNSTAKVVKGDLYIGDEDGLTVTFSPAVYDIIFYENEMLVQGIPSSARVTDEGSALRHIRLYPGINDTTNWRIVAVRKGLSTMNPKYIATIFEFNFYSWLPDVELKNQSLESIEGLLEGGRTAGIVVVKYSNEDRLFNSVISYTRTYENPRKPGETITDRVTMSRSTSTFTLTQEGIYRIEIMNEVWARAIYTFEITDVSNTSYKMIHHTVDEGGKPVSKELIQSPELLSWNSPQGNTRIPIYWVIGSSRLDVTLNMSQANASKNNDCKIEIVISPNTPREIWGRVSGADAKNTVYEWVDGNTVVYRLRSVTEPEHEFYFAVGFVSASSLNNINQVFTDEGSRVNWVESAQYRLYTQIHENGIVYGLHVNYNTYTTNVMYVDYWRNDVYCGRLIGKEQETLKIQKEDYGVYKFYIYDWAGNLKKFVNETYDHFTIINLCSGPLLMNGETIVDGMVFNDKLELSVLDIPYHPMSQNHAYISSLRVTDGYENRFEFYALNKSEERQSFVFSAPGLYKFYIDFRILIGSTVLEMPSMYTVYLVSSTVAIQGEFSYGPFSNIEIVGLRHNKVDIRRNWSQKHLSEIRLNASSGGNGIYVVTVEIAADGIREAYRREFVVVIGFLPVYPGIISSNIEGLFGSNTTSKVEIYASPSIPHIFGDSVIIIEREYEGTRTEILRKPVGLHNVAELEYAIAELNTQEEPLEGIFEVRLESPNGGVFLSEAFQIGTPISGLNILVILIFMGVLVVAAFAFIYIRTRVRAR